MKIRYPNCNILWSYFSNVWPIEYLTASCLIVSLLLFFQSSWIVFTKVYRLPWTNEKMNKFQMIWWTGEAMWNNICRKPTHNNRYPRKHANHYAVQKWLNSHNSRPRLLMHLRKKTPIREHFEKSFEANSYSCTQFPLKRIVNTNHVRRLLKLYVFHMLWDYYPLQQ